MIIKGANGNKFTFTLRFVTLSKVCEQTGYVYTKKPVLTKLPLDVGIDNHIWQQSILISEIEQVIKWFENLLLNNVEEDVIEVYYKQLKFELLKHNPNFKKIRITHDSSIPIPFMGGYSLATGFKYEDVFKKISIEFEMDVTEQKRIVQELVNELNDSNRVLWK